jgi:hypothetical protein
VDPTLVALGVVAMSKSDAADSGVFWSFKLRTVIWFLAGTLAMAQTAVANPQTGSVSSVPRTADGKPDLSGVWEVLNTAAWDIQPHNADAGIPGGLGVVEGGEIPYQASALAVKKKNFEHRMAEDTDSKCYLPGVPRVTYMPYPFQIAQTTNYVTILYEYRHINRTFPTNGSKHPEAEVDYWMGDSRGHWDADTLVVDVVNFNDQTWFDKVGDYHSDALHVVEHYSLIDKDHMNYEVTMEDPKVFTRPWKMSMPVYRRIEPDIRVLEYDCNAFEHLFHVPEGAGQAHGGHE